MEELFFNEPGRGTTCNGGFALTEYVGLRTCGGACLPPAGVFEGRAGFTKGFGFAGGANLMERWQGGSPS